MLVPRDYQLAALNALESARLSGQHRALIVMATGLGKTVTAAWEIQTILATEPKARVLVLCHQNEILDQNQQRFKEVLGDSVDMGLYLGLKRDEKPQITFASFQSLTNRLEAISPEAYDYVVVDEVHHIEAETFNKVFNHFKPKFAWGMTATKERGDGQSIEKTLGPPVFNLELPQAMARGLLTKVNYFVLADDMVRVGEITVDNYKVTKAELNRRIFIPRRDEEIVRRIEEAWETIERPHTIVFARGIEHAENLAKLLGGEVFYEGMSKNRKEVLDAFRSGNLSTIVAVNLFNEGIDVPEANCIVFARSTQSRTIFYQQLGRGLRPTDDKRSVTVLDFVADVGRLETLQAVARDVEGEARRIGSSVRLGQGTASDGDGRRTLGVNFDSVPGEGSSTGPPVDGQPGPPIVRHPPDDDPSPPEPPPVVYLEAGGITFNFDVNSVELEEYLARRNRLYTEEGILDAAVSIIQEQGLGRALTQTEVRSLSKDGRLPSAQFIVDQFGDDDGKSGWENFRNAQHKRLGLPQLRRPADWSDEEILGAALSLIHERGLRRALFPSEVRELSEHDRLPSVSGIVRRFADDDGKNGWENFRKMQYERLGQPARKRSVDWTEETILDAAVAVIQERELRRALSRSEVDQLSKDDHLPSRPFITDRFAHYGDKKNGWENFREAQYDRLQLPEIRAGVDWTDDEIVDIAVAIIQERGLRRALTKKEIDSLSKQGRLPFSDSIARRFADDGGKNGWEKFRRAQCERIQLPDPLEMSTSKEAIVDAVVSIIEEGGLSGAPSDREVKTLSDQLRLPSRTTIILRFNRDGKNGWKNFRSAVNDALSRRQIPTSRKGVDWSKEAIVGAVVSLIEGGRLSRVPQQREVNDLSKQRRLVSAGTIQRRFGDGEGENGWRNFTDAVSDALRQRQQTLTSAEASVPPGPSPSWDRNEQTQVPTPTSDTGSLV